MLDNIKVVFAKIWDFIVRARIYVLGALAILIEIGPGILASAEVAEIVPDDWRHFLAITLLVWSRWRLASRAADPEVQVKIAAKAEAAATGKPVALMIRPTGEDAVKIATVEPKRTPA